MNESAKGTKIGWGRLILESVAEAVLHELNKEHEEDPHRGYWEDCAGEEWLGDTPLT